MKREDLTKLFKLHATLMGIGFGAVALGLWYHNCKEQEVISEPPAAITESLEENISPQP